MDTSRMNQVLYNLLSNALRYTPNKGAITVSTFTKTEGDKQWVVFAVADNGIGIAEEDLPFVFNHFYRADKSRTRASGGSGIDLPS